LNGWCEWQSNDTGVRSIYFRITGTDYNPKAIPPVTGGVVTRHGCVFTGPLVAGDTVRLTVYQTNTGLGALTISATTNLSIDRIHN
jgi:hypothetical protein